MRDALLDPKALPGHWTCKPLRFIASLNCEKLPESTPSDTPLRYVDIASVGSDGSLQAPEEMLFEDAPSRARRLARAGDTAISTVRTYLKAIAYVDRDHADCVWSTGFAIVSPGDEVDGRYLYWVSRSTWFIAEIQRRSVGVSYPAVNAEDVAEIMCPVPPIDEQRRIADLLEHEIGNKNAVRQALRRQVGLLRERIDALITATVVGDLRAGTIPIRYVAEVRVSSVDKKSDESQVPVRLCNYTDVYHRDAIHQDQDFMEATATPEQVRAFKLRARDVVITKDSETPDDIGVAAYVQKGAQDLVCGYHLALLRPDERLIDGRFLYWAMHSRPIRSQLSAAATGVTRFGLRIDAIRSVRVPRTSLERQRQIAESLDREVEAMSNLTQVLKQQINLLDEREDALITAAVTGELDPSSYHAAVPA